MRFHSVIQIWTNVEKHILQTEDYFFFTLNIVQGDMNGFPTLYLFLSNNVFVIPFNHAGSIFDTQG